MEPKKVMVLFVKDAEFVKRHTAVEKNNNILLLHEWRQFVSKANILSNIKEMKRDYEKEIKLRRNCFDL